MHFEAMPYRSHDLENIAKVPPRSKLTTLGISQVMYVSGTTSILNHRYLMIRSVSGKMYGTIPSPSHLVLS